MKVQNEIEVFSLDPDHFEMLFLPRSEVFLFGANSFSPSK